MKAKKLKKIKKFKKIGIALMIVSSIIFMLDISIWSDIETPIPFLVWLLMFLIGLYLKEVYPMLVENKERKDLMKGKY